MFLAAEFQSLGASVVNLFYSKKGRFVQSLNILKEMYSHMIWADAKVWDSVFLIKNSEKKEQLKV